ncbi:MAG: hypothetical protein V1766_13585, partial [Pseudomonadota bacterium]
LASLALRLSRAFEPTPPLAAALRLVFGTSTCNKLQLPRPKTAAQQPAIAYAYRRICRFYASFKSHFS